MPAPKTIGVIGLGSIGMRHAKNLIAVGHKVIGHDIDPDRMMMAGSLGVTPARGRGSLVEMAGNIIAAPTRTHLHHIKQSIAADLPLFIEKPIADGSVDEIRELFLELETPIMVGNNLRFHSCVKKAKEWLTEGLIGKPLWASFCVAQHSDKPMYLRDGVLLNWGAHEFDLALYLLGPATVTAAATHTVMGTLSSDLNALKPSEDIADVCLLHEHGVPSTVHCDYVTAPQQRWFSISGSDGRIYVDIPGRWAQISGEKANSTTRDTEGSFDQDYKDEIAAFIDLIDGKPVPHAATGQDGLNALELILEAQRMAGIHDQAV